MSEQLQPKYIDLDTSHVDGLLKAAIQRWLSLERRNRLAKPLPIRAGSQTGGFGIAIPANAPHKEAAFLLMQWLTSKEADIAIAMAGGNPSRFSTHENAEVVAAFPHMPIFGEALKDADPDWRPIIPVWGSINADLGTALSKVLTEDLNIQEALDGVAERTRATMEDAGYYTWTN